MENPHNFGAMSVNGKVVNGNAAASLKSTIMCVCLGGFVDFEISVSVKHQRAPAFAAP